jgi:DNA polymerase-1
VATLELEGRRTFALIAGDHAAYVVGHGAGAVEMARRAETIAVDIETHGFGRLRWELTAAVIGTAELVYILDPVADAAAIRDALEIAGELTFFNATYDVPALIAAGLMALEHVDKVYDVLISARLAHPTDEAKRDLVTCARRYLGAGYERAKRQAKESWRRATNLPMAEMYRRATLGSEPFVIYAGFDGIMTARLRAVIDAAVADRFADHPFKSSGDADAIIEREQTVNRMLLRRSAVGLGVDLEAIDALEVELHGAYRSAVDELAGWGIDGTLAPTTVKRNAVGYLAAHELLPPDHPRLLDGTPTAAAPSLARIDHPLGAVLRRYAQAERWVRDYAAKVTELARDGAIHPEVAVCIAATGRMSYSAPPLQQFPETIRRIFEFPTPATSLDFSSIEPAVFAYLAGEELLIAPYEAGADLYGPVVAAAGVPRPVAKTALLAQLYGQGAPALSLRLGMTVADTAALIERTLGPFHAIRDAKRAITRIGDVYGKVQTISGRIVLLERDPRTGNRRFMGYRGIACTV